MKIIVSHVFSNDNKGDAALLSVLLRDMKMTFNNPEITILSIDKITTDETFDGYPVVNSLMFFALNRYQNRIIKFFYSFFVIFTTVVWAYIYKKTNIKVYLPSHLKVLVELYSAADLVLPVGGGYMRGKPDITSTILLFLLLHPFVLSRILCKPTVIYPQSVGPFGNSIQKFLVSRVLKNVELMFIREDVSVNLLKTLLIDKNVVRTVDSGFAFNGDSALNLKQVLEISNDNPIVGITVRKWMKKSNQDLYEKEMALFCEYIIANHNVNVVFIPQVTAVHHNDDDREVGQRVYNLMKIKTAAFVVAESYDHNIIKSIYSQLDFTVGTRFHSVIFSLTSNVPAIAIEYEHKTSGIMHDLNLGQWVIKIEDVTAEKLIALFKKMFDGRQEYVNDLTAIIPPYVKRTAEVPVLVKQIYEQSLITKLSH